MAGLDKHFDGVKPTFFSLAFLFTQCIWHATFVCVCIGGAVIFSRSFIETGLF
jgi:hypothetical protein